VNAMLNGVFPFKYLHKETYSKFKKRYLEILYFYEWTIIEEILILLF
jgi:hypothetical protein